jgi:hypothetical protein
MPQAAMTCFAKARRVIFCSGSRSIWAAWRVSRSRPRITWPVHRFAGQGEGHGAAACARRATRCGVTRGGRSPARMAESDGTVGKGVRSPCDPRSALVTTLVALAEHFAQYLRQQSLFAHQQRRTLGPARRDVGQHQGLYKAAARDRPTVGHQVRRRECCYGRVSRAKLPTGRVPVPRWYSETTLR